MTLVRGICDYLYVLDFGLLIFEGTTGEMEQSAQVRSAYLGETITAPVGAFNETIPMSIRSIAPSE